jgi:hypothetical protein
MNLTIRNDQPVGCDPYSSRVALWPCCLKSVPKVTIRTPQHLHHFVSSKASRVVPLADQRAVLLQHAFQARRRRPRPGIARPDGTGVAEVEPPGLRVEYYLTVEPSNECSLANLNILLKRLHHEAIREK